MGNEETSAYLQGAGCQQNASGVIPQVGVSWSVIPGAVSYNVYDCCGTAGVGCSNPLLLTNIDGGATSYDVKLCASAATSYLAPAPDLSGAVCARTQNNGIGTLSGKGDAGSEYNCMDGTGIFNSAIETTGLTTVSVLSSTSAPGVSSNAGTGTTYTYEYNALTTDGATPCSAGGTVSGGATPNNTITFQNLEPGYNTIYQVIRTVGGTGQGVIGWFVDPPGGVLSFTDNNLSATGYTCPLVNTTGAVTTNGPLIVNAGLWWNNTLGIASFYGKNGDVVLDAGIIPPIVLANGANLNNCGVAGGNACLTAVDGGNAQLQAGTAAAVLANASSSTAAIDDVTDSQEVVCSSTTYLGGGAGCSATKLYCSGVMAVGGVASLNAGFTSAQGGSIDGGVTLDGGGNLGIASQGGLANELTVLGGEVLSGAVQADAGVIIHAGFHMPQIQAGTITGLTTQSWNPVAFSPVFSTTPGCVCTCKLVATDVAPPVCVVDGGANGLTTTSAAFACFDGGVSNPVANHNIFYSCQNPQ